jgi:hypothetical protein
MSVAGILASSLFQLGGAQQNSAQQLRASVLQKVGQDLQTGNLAGAQADFASLTQNSATAPGTSASPLGQAFNALGQALQSGNLTAAQQDFSTIQQDLQQVGQSLGHHHHHHHMSAQNSSSSSNQQSNSITQAFGALGQALQAGNTAAAQQAYATIQQDMQLFNVASPFGSTSLGSASASAAGGGLSVTM